MQIIDAQVHLWAGKQAPPHHWRAPYTMESALRGMNEAGITRSVNCPAIWDPDAMGYAVEAGRLHPERFATLGWFDLDVSADESLVEHWINQPGMRGLRFVLATPELLERLQIGKLDWLWAVAEQRDIPVGLFVMPQHLPLVGDIAARHPRMRLLIDHLAVHPFAKLPEAAAHLNTLLALAQHPNIAVKATGVPSMATDSYPFASTHEVLRQTFNAFGAERMFWGSDITRLQCTWRECVTLFTEELPWLKGRDLELVMGSGIAHWIGWH